MWLYSSVVSISSGSSYACSGNNISRRQELDQERWVRRNGATRGGIWDSIPTALALLQIEKLKCKMHFPCRTSSSLSPKPHSDPGLALCAQEEQGPHQASRSWLSHRWSTKGASPAEKEPDRPGAGSTGAFLPAFFLSGLFVKLPFS